MRKSKSGCSKKNKKRQIKKSKSDNFTSAKKSVSKNSTEDVFSDQDSHEEVTTVQLDSIQQDEQSDNQTDLIIDTCVRDSLQSTYPTENLCDQNKIEHPNEQSVTEAKACDDTSHSDSYTNEISNGTLNDTPNCLASVKKSRRSAYEKKLSILVKLLNPYRKLSSTDNTSSTVKQTTIIKSSRSFDSARLYRKLSTIQRHYSSKVNEPKHKINKVTESNLENTHNKSLKLSSISNIRKAKAKLKLLADKYSVKSSIGKPNLNQTKEKCKLSKPAKLADFSSQEHTANTNVSLVIKKHGCSSEEQYDLNTNNSNGLKKISNSKSNHSSYSSFENNIRNSGSKKQSVEEIQLTAQASIETDLTSHSNIRNEDSTNNIGCKTSNDDLHTNVILDKNNTIKTVDLIKTFGDQQQNYKLDNKSSSLVASDRIKTLRKNLTSSSIALDDSIYFCNYGRYDFIQKDNSDSYKMVSRSNDSINRSLGMYNDTGLCSSPGMLYSSLSEFYVSCDENIRSHDSIAAAGSIDFYQHFEHASSQSNKLSNYTEATVLHSKTDRPELTSNNCYSTPRLLEESISEKERRVNDKMNDKNNDEQKRNNTVHVSNPLNVSTAGCLVDLMALQGIESANTINSDSGQQILPNKAIHTLMNRNNLSTGCVSKKSDNLLHADSGINELNQAQNNHEMIEQSATRIEISHDMKKENLIHDESNVCTENSVNKKDSISHNHSMEDGEKEVLQSIEVECLDEKNRENTVENAQNSDNKLPVINANEQNANVNDKTADNNLNDQDHASLHDDNYTVVDDHADYFRLINPRVNYYKCTEWQIGSYSDAMLVRTNLIDFIEFSQELYNTYNPVSQDFSSDGVRSEEFLYSLCVNINYFINIINLRLLANIKENRNIDNDEDFKNECYMFCDELVSFLQVNETLVLENYFYLLANQQHAVAVLLFDYLLLKILSMTMRTNYYKLLNNNLSLSEANEHQLTKMYTDYYKDCSKLMSQILQLYLNTTSASENGCKQSAQLDALESLSLSDLLKATLANFIKDSLSITLVSNKSNHINVYSLLCNVDNGDKSINVTSEMQNKQLQEVARKLLEQISLLIKSQCSTDLQQLIVSNSEDVASFILCLVDTIVRSVDARLSEYLNNKYNDNGNIQKDKIELSCKLINDIIGSWFKLMLADYKCDKADNCRQNNTYKVLILEIKDDLTDWMINELFKLHENNSLYLGRSIMSSLNTYAKSYLDDMNNKIITKTQVSSLYEASLRSFQNSLSTEINACMKSFASNEICKITHTLIKLPVECIGYFDYVSELCFKHAINKKLYQKVTDQNIYFQQESLTMTPYAAFFLQVWSFSMKALASSLKLNLQDCLVFDYDVLEVPALNDNLISTFENCILKHSSQVYSRELLTRFTTVLETTDIDSAEYVEVFLDDEQNRQFIDCLRRFVSRIQSIASVIPSTNCDTIHLEANNVLLEDPESGKKEPINNIKQLVNHSQQTTNESDDVLHQKIFNEEREKLIQSLRDECKFQLINDTNIQQLRLSIYEEEKAKIINAMYEKAKSELSKSESDAKFRKPTLTNLIMTADEKLHKITLDEFNTNRSLKSALHKFYDNKSCANSSDVLDLVANELEEQIQLNTLETLLDTNISFDEITNKYEKTLYALNEKLSNQLKARLETEIRTSLETELENKLSAEYKQKVKDFLSKHIKNNKNVDINGQINKDDNDDLDATENEIMQPDSKPINCRQQDNITKSSLGTYIDVAEPKAVNVEDLKVKSGADNDLLQKYPKALSILTKIDSLINKFSEHNQDCMFRLLSVCIASQCKLVCQLNSNKDIDQHNLFNGKNNLQLMKHYAKMLSRVLRNNLSVEQNEVIVIQNIKRKHRSTFNESLLKLTPLAITTVTVNGDAVANLNDTKQETNQVNYSANPSLEQMACKKNSIFLREHDEIADEKPKYNDIRVNERCSRMSNSISSHKSASNQSLKLSPSSNDSAVVVKKTVEFQADCLNSSLHSLHTMFLLCNYVRDILSTVGNSDEKSRVLMDGFNKISVAAVNNIREILIFQYTCLKSSELSTSEIAVRQAILKRITTNSIDLRDKGLAIYKKIMKNLDKVISSNRQTLESMKSQLSATSAEKLMLLAESNKRIDDINRLKAKLETVQKLNDKLTNYELLYKLYEEDNQIKQKQINKLSFDLQKAMKRLEDMNMQKVVSCQNGTNDMMLTQFTELKKQYDMTYQSYCNLRKINDTLMLDLANAEKNYAKVKCDAKDTISEISAMYKAKIQRLRTALKDAQTFLKAVLADFNRLHSLMLQKAPALSKQFSYNELEVVKLSERRKQSMV